MRKPGCRRAGAWLCRWGMMISLMAGFTTAHAQSSIPANILADLRSAAAVAQQDEQRVARLTTSISDPLLADRMRREGQRQSATTFSYVVNAAIAQQPHAAVTIVQAATGIAPHLRDDIVNSAITAYPGFRNAILAAGPHGTVPSARATPIRTAQPQQAPLLPTPREPSKREYSPPPPSRDPDSPVWDPWEPLNRPLFAVYQVLDDFLVRPVAASYGWVVPDPIKEGVRHAFENLESPVIFVNDVVQLDFPGAATTLGRFTINSTVGGLGFFDVAERAGLRRHPADFAQTLNRYHIPAGPYLVLPIIGPGTIRSHLGGIVDIATHPFTWMRAVEDPVRVGLMVGDAVTKRETLLEPLDELRKDSVDWYATFRATYYQNRAVELRKGVVQPSSAENDLFDAFE